MRSPFSRVRMRISLPQRAAVFPLAALAAVAVGMVGGPTSEAGPRRGDTCDGGCPIEGRDGRKEARPAPRGAPFVTLPDVSLSHRVSDKLTRIAELYHRRTGKTLVVTSGTRDPLSQAEAIYDKLQAGDDIVRLYRNKQAAQELQKAYERTQSRGRAATLSAMAQTIKSQISRGIYISSHLRAGAADIRSTDMTPLERRHFVDGALSTKGVSVLYESIPPHFHVQLE